VHNLLQPFWARFAIANNQHVRLIAQTFIDLQVESDTLSVSGAGTITAANNGYRSGLSAISGDSSPKTGLVADYQVGPMANHFGYLGTFYYPTSGSSTSLTNLVNAGSRTASAASLYHYTTRVDQTKDSSTVDIGFHYIALDGNDDPNDSDSDGLPDYFEDRNGNGSSTPDNNETAWQDSSDLGLQVIITEPKSNSNIP
jgi:hypothetical protein